MAKHHLYPEEMPMLGGGHDIMRKCQDGSGIATALEYSGIRTEFWHLKIMEQRQLFP